MGAALASTGAGAGLVLRGVNPRGAFLRGAMTFAAEVLPSGIDVRVVRVGAVVAALRVAVSRVGAVVAAL